MQETNFDPSLLNEIVDQAHNPPGGDPVLGAFYKATLQAIDTQQPFAELVAKVKSNRLDITDKHLVNLLFRTFQFLRLGKGDLRYRAVDDVEWWCKELAGIAGRDDQRAAFEYVLKHRSTTTTIYQRYAGPYAILANLLNGNSVTVTDLGCGGNYGLRGIELREPFKPIDDKTPKKQVVKFLSQPINLLSGLAVDKEEPDDEEIKRWRLACSFYPQELDEIESLQAFEERIKGSRRVMFIKGDLLEPDFTPRQQSQVLILSTILYQLNRQNQIRLLEKAKDWIESDGILIVQDFAEKDSKNPTHLDFSESWFGRAFSYRTFMASAKTNWMFQEILQWNNGRCTSVRAGQDFNVVFSETQASSLSAAFAHSTS